MGVAQFGREDVAEAGAQIHPVQCVRTMCAVPGVPFGVHCYLKMVPALLELACSLIMKVTAPASECHALSRKFVTFKVP